MNRVLYSGRGGDDDGSGEKAEMEEGRERKTVRIAKEGEEEVEIEERRKFMM